MHPCQETMAIRRAVVYYAWAAHIFSAGIKCRHCRNSAATATAAAAAAALGIFKERLDLFSYSHSFFQCMSRVGNWKRCFPLCC